MPPRCMSASIGALCCSLLRACPAAPIKLLMMTLASCLLLLTSAFDDGDDFKPALSRYTARQRRHQPAAHLHNI